MENLYHPNSIRTYTGKYINIFDPNPDDILIEDIAHALAQMPRFGGHLKNLYTVAQHSIWCTVQLMLDKSINCTKAFLLACLLHDASEAYIIDLPKPIKNGLPDYQKAEDHLMRMIAQKYNFEYPLHPLIKDIDSQALSHEWHHYMLGNDVPEYDFLKIKTDFLTLYNKILTEYD